MSAAPTPWSPTVLDADKFDWQDSETGNGGAEVIVAGYLLEYAPRLGDDGEPVKDKWFWAVHSTAEVSETPELIDTGDARSIDGARYGCGKTIRKLVREREAKKEAELAAVAKAQKAAKPAKDEQPKAKPARKAAKAKAAA